MSPSELFKKIKRKFFGQVELVKVFSHPRSGTNLLEAFIASNFYKGLNLERGEVEWGHWSNRKILADTLPYGKLFGSHVFPDFFANHSRRRVAYIFRDGRAVAHSVWKTDNFMNPALRGISFSEFLNTPLDWIGTPAVRFNGHDRKNIVQHWLAHVSGWHEIARRSRNIVLIRYEDLIHDPYSVYRLIHQKFFPKQGLLPPSQVDPVSKLVGLFPNSGVVDSWRDVFTGADLDLFFSHVPRSCEYLWHEGR